jgi:hypothetical protein
LPREQPGGGLAYEVELASGPFQRITFRHSRPGATSGWSIVSLQVRPAVLLRKADFPKALLGGRGRHDGHDGREGTVTHSRDRPSGRTLFVFSMQTGLFESAIFQRGAAMRTP